MKNNKEPKSVEVVTVGKIGHVTTRAHNRHLIYYPVTGTWYAFVGTGDALYERGANALFTSQDGEKWNLKHLFCHGYGTSSSQDAILFKNQIYLLHYPNDWRVYDPRYGGTPWDGPVDYKVREYFLPTKFGNAIAFNDYTAIHGKYLSNLHFYGSICRDSNGYIWIGTRSVIREKKDHLKVKTTLAFATRSTRQNDVSKWDKPILVGKRPLD